MAVRELDTTARVARPPRAMAWVVVLASAAAVLLVGLLATGLVFGNVGGWQAPPSPFWWRLGAACALTVVSLTLRSLRWIFLLRRAETRIPIRDAYIGYFAGFSLLFTPLIVGESAVRAIVHRRRGGVPILTTLVVNVWERAIDVVALLVIAAVASLWLGAPDALPALVLAAVVFTLVTPARRFALRVVIGVVGPLARRFEPSKLGDFRRLYQLRTWLVAVTTSIVAWVLPGLGLWLLVGSWPVRFSAADAELLYGQSSVAGGALLAPGGVIVAGRQMLDVLTAHGLDDSGAALAVLGVRLATVGVSTALGLVFALVHLRTVPASSDTHFDDIADAYDVQIPESRRLALLELKTTQMKRVIEERRGGRRGLDVGCGQGAYVARMRELGFDVNGIDMSAGQIALAARNVGDASLVRVGSVLEIPAADASYDFLYTINVLHHLGSVEEQRRAFVELLRVLKPGGLLFVHEINTTNILFRFYMGYVFPSLNCIDEGVERWLLPRRLSTYTPARVVDVRYFTFLPEFIPQALARVLRPVERMLEQSAWRAYSAHYMAVLEKDAGA